MNKYNLLMIQKKQLGKELCHFLLTDVCLGI